MGLVVSWVVGELDCLVGGLVLVEHLVGWFVSGLGASFGRTVGASVTQSVSQTCGWVFQFLGLSLWLLIGCWVVGQSVVWAVVVSESESFGWFFVGMIGLLVVNRFCV